MQTCWVMLRRSLGAIPQVGRFSERYNTTKDQRFVCSFDATTRQKNMITGMSYPYLKSDSGHKKPNKAATLFVRRSTLNTIHNICL